ncbi:dihydrofolate reductase [Maudiozyma exigua]|uniref:Dihydrofolate reductase n=1 Tax=Maudiozyma exigua TaxID=34358 RepID=A0A9P7BBS6_MAUEX|nr:dihydrofolate reductase [Kazachstania exigua]
MTVPKIDVVCIVATLLPDFGIGCQGGLPWKLSKEMKYFRQVTSGTLNTDKRNAVIMGRKTWESIPLKFRPLPSRYNVVISRSYDSQLTIEKMNDDSDKFFYKINSLEDGIKQIKEKLGDSLERIYIIGGGQIYSNSYSISDKLLITKLEIESQDIERPEMDTFLNIKHIQDEFRDISKDLKQYLPSTVTLPEPTANNDYIEREKGYKFQYTLYEKK